MKLRSYIRRGPNLVTGKPGFPGRKRKKGAAQRPAHHMHGRGMWDAYLAGRSRTR